MRVAVPEAQAITAAWTLVRIPPVPIADPRPATLTRTRSSGPRTRRTGSAPGASGRAVHIPSTSVNRTMTSAATRWETSAARWSLSPRLNSVVATASFSLTTGTAPMDSRASKVARTVR